MAYDLTPFEIEMANFADRIEIIVGLEIGNKLSAEEAYKEIKLLMKDLKKARKTYNKGADDNVVQR